MTSAPIGRPRSEEARRAILLAARDLIAAEGYDAVTMVQIATTARVGRQTIYRWWPTKEAVVADAVLSHALPVDLVLAQPTGDLRHDLLLWADRSAHVMAGPGSAPMFRALLAAAALDERAARRMQEDLAEPLRVALRAAFAAAARPDPADAAADVLLGALLHDLLVRATATLPSLRSAIDLVTRD